MGARDSRKLKTITEQTDNTNNQEQDSTNDGSNPTSNGNDGSNPTSNDLFKENLDEGDIHANSRESETSSGSPNTKRRKMTSS